jgi:hypothetical protein
MSDSGPTSKPFVGRDRRSDILGKLAERARANPPAKTPEDIAARVAVAIHMQSKPPKDDKEEGRSNNDDGAAGDNDGVEDPGLFSSQWSRGSWRMRVRSRAARQRAFRMLEPPAARIRL